MKEKPKHVYLSTPDLQVLFFFFSFLNHLKVANSYLSGQTVASEFIVLSLSLPVF